MRSNSIGKAINPTAKIVQPCVRCGIFKGYQPGGLCAKCYRTPGVREEYQTSKRCDLQILLCQNCQKEIPLIPSRAKRRKFCGRSCATTYNERQIHISDADRFWNLVDKSGDCWVWKGHCCFGYGQFALEPQKPVKAHRFSYELAHGPIPDGLMVCHHCDNPPCVRPEHLFLGTAKDNTQDSIRKGRSYVGNSERIRARIQNPLPRRS